MIPIRLENRFSHNWKHQKTLFFEKNFSWEKRCVEKNFPAKNIHKIERVPFDQIEQLEKSQTVEKKSRKERSTVGLFNNL